MRLVTVLLAIVWAAGVILFAVADVSVFGLSTSWSSFIFGALWTTLILIIDDLKHKSHKG